MKDLESENVSHAYLFDGPGHLGKMTTAFWFASKLLTYGLEGEEAEEVIANVERLTHSDLLVLDQLWIEEVCEDWSVIAQSSNVSQEHRSKKPAAKTDVISIDDIRALQDRLYEKGRGKYRCCIIRSVERMQDSAANALLKLLEEPPNGLVFILTTQARTSLLPTIASRTRNLMFHRVANKELLPFISGLEEDDAQFILRIAQGAPGIAQKLSEDPERLVAHKQAHAQAHKFWRSPSLTERISLLESLRERGDEADRMMLHLALALRESGSSLEKTQPLSRLAQGLQTNAHRQLLTQQFALSIGG